MAGRVRGGLEGLGQEDKGILVKDTVGSKVCGPAGMWEEVRESYRPAHPPISKKSPCGQHLPLSLERSYLYPAQAPRPICSSTAGTDRHMAAEAPEDTPSRILARGLGHLPTHLPLQPGPTVGHMPGACPLGGHGWAQASHPQACRVDPTLALVCVALFEDCPPRPVRWVASAWTHRRDFRWARSRP